LLNLKDTGANKHRHPAGHVNVFIADSNDSLAMLTIKYLPHIIGRQTTVCENVTAIYKTPSLN